MARRRFTVDRYSEIERRLRAGRSLREIARALGCSRRTVREVRDGLRAAPGRTVGDPLWMSQVEWPAVLHELGLGHPLKFIWEERAQSLTTYPNFWKQFYRKFPELKQATVTARDFAPGERVEVDYAGDPLEWIDLRTGEIHSAWVFVAGLGCSQLLFAWAAEDMKSRHWLDSHQRMYAFYGGVPHVTVPDFVAGNKIREQRARHAGKALERPHVPVEEATHRSVQVEAQEQLSRVGEHHHERHQRSLGPSHPQPPEVRPVHLPLLPRKGAQAQIRLSGGPRPVARNDRAEVLGTARIAALAHHPMEATRPQRRVARQDLEHERQVRIDHRGTHDLRHDRHARLREHAAHRGVMQLQLAGERAHGPVLGVMEAQDLRLERARDHDDEPDGGRSPAAPGPGADPRPARQRGATEGAARPERGIVVA